MELFQNRKLIIATKHQKESVIAPILEAQLGVICFTDPTFDTDTLGTFSGEVERINNPLETARLKCLKAMKLNNCDLGVASEGSFGPHPTMYFASADDEFLIFIDKKNNLEIVARELSTETNFNGKTIRNERDLLEFTELVKFPSHGLILKKSKTDTEGMIKGITTLPELQRAYEFMYQKYSTVYAETDMRAMLNPTRMHVIELAAQKLADKIQSLCPECKTPGFGITDLNKGLPCDLCGSPTQSTLSVIYTCANCNHTQEDFYPNDKKVEDPMYCDFCNP
ncbi:DUF6671 family protein [Winogradskyella sp.]|uniref:DUF6671 family protein n=1 Tax=Winogradskyella sp. TaxID=1883156 RepID=UPI0026303595|nr:DUF6671 family protein [Winogradskyella sp.]